MNIELGRKIKQIGLENDGHVVSVSKDMKEALELFKKF